MDLRDFIGLCESKGDLKRVTAEVDWDLEMSHIAKLVEERDGPSMLFENVKGCIGSVMFGAYSNTKRLAMCLGKPADMTMTEISYEWMKLSIGEIIPKKQVETGPIFENVIEEQDIDIYKLPAPKFYEKDGGRYIGTACFMVVKDPETGEINLGTYRSQVLDAKTVGAQILKGKRGDRILQKYRKKGEKMPICLVVGCDPLLMLAGSAMVENADEYDVVGTLRGEPVEVVTAPLTGLPIPATAEFVLEGYIDGDNLRSEGPFGEYTGYYTEEIYKQVDKPAIEVKRIYHRNDPILLAASVGRPVNDNHMMLAFVRNATLWTELTRMGIKGIQSVYMPPEACGRFWAIVSLKQMYPGHSNQVAAAVIASNTCTYGLKGLIIVDDDIAADDLPRVWWALATRYDPERSTQIINRGRSTPLDPALHDKENKFITSRIIMDATIPFEWEDKPVKVEMSQEVLENIKSRWEELGLD
ncbi:MAG: phenylphosphate carboxylase subunit beta [Deltaproteobacteria bacterium]|nr:MAG: phenylphosphate carboxylase subunit beta [Deltaproteobacteria bacterium]